MVGSKKQYLLAALLVVVPAVTSWANVPPPPVNQTLGIPDASFNNLVESECRTCHQNTSIVNPGTIPDRHHLLVNKPLHVPDSAPFNTSETTYQCLSCHQQVWSTTTTPPQWVFNTFRDCLFCHHQNVGNASVHHLTAKAQAENCKACHGLIDDPRDGVDNHYIPTYAPSLVTPWPSDKPNDGTNGEGQCTFCHAAGLNTATNLNVLSNMETHHGTGLSIPNPAACTWCHDTLAPDNKKIRQCEKCHGVASLHNIQANSPNAANLATIVPGKEDAYYGHIGNNADCFGCHGATGMSAAAPGSGSVMPDVSGLSLAKVTAGTAAVITAKGTGFTNVVETPTGNIVLTSKVVLTPLAGTPVELVPTAITANSLKVTLPATLKAGNYDFRVVKADKTSNAVHLSVVPAVKNTSIVSSGKNITIKGTGYSQYFNASNSGAGLVATDSRGKKVPCKVTGWSNTQITATCQVAPNIVTVSSIWGKATTQIKK